MTAGFFAPLAPARTGVADYAAALIEAMKEGGRVVVNREAAGTALYHLGNNQLHRDIYRRALEKPGVAVLHDAVLNHFLLGALDQRAYLEEFIYNYGDWSRDLAAELWRRRARSASDPRYFAYPMLRRVAETSRAIVVHNSAAAEMVRAHAPQARVFEIPHLWMGDDPPECDVIRLRERLGARPPVFLFGVFGHLRESKRLPSILKAFEAARRAAPDARLLVAGEFVSREFERAMAPLVAAEGVIRVGYTREREFRLLLAAVDAGISLRYPAAGETSGIAVRLMGAAKPVLLSAGRETACIPETACLRVEAGPSETALLAAYMTWLARSPETARQIGRRARRHIREQHDPRRVAGIYWNVLGGAAA